MPTDMRLRRAVGAALVGVAAVMAVMAVANLPARLLALPGDEARDAVMAMDQPQDEEAFASFVSSRRAALKWRRSAEYAADLAHAYALHADRSDNPHQADDAIAARRFQSQSLKWEPANSYGWSEMASFTLEDGTDDGRALDYLRLSEDVAPYEPLLLAARLDMLQEFRDGMNAEDQAALVTLAQQAFDVDPPGVYRNARQNNYVALIAQAISGNSKRESILADLERRDPPTPAPAAAPQPAP